MRLSTVSPTRDLGTDIMINLVYYVSRLIRHGYPLILKIRENTMGSLKFLQIQQPNTVLFPNEPRNKLNTINDKNKITKRINGIPNIITCHHRDLN